jgi:DNA-binding IclR family transcriptional regulator
MAKKEKSRPSLSGVAAVDRAFAILTAFRRGDRSLELTELAARTGLVKSTIMRLAISLEKLGLMARQPDGSYRLGAETLRLGSVYQSSLDIEHHVMPVLEKLVEQTGESASLYVRRGNQRLCLFRVDSPHRLRLVVQAGETRPMDGSAIAQVLRNFRDTRSLTDKSLTQPPLYTAGATDPHTAAIAMPVFGADLRLVGALALSGPVPRLTPERFAEISPILASAAWTVSRSLGATRPDGG